ncbi:PilN domain-containing protein [Microbacteriaceae bacterium K1510]|nr:PilN domain-containing protein [Microbacteriaceae bacterium K1510]
MSAIDRAWQWFVDGLAEAVAASLDRFVRPPSYRIAVGDENIVQDSAGCTLGRLAVAGESLQFEPQELAARLNHATVDIDLPAQWLWRRSLQPVGVQSAPYLDAFVQHHIERISPWRMGDVYYKIITCPLPDDPSRLAVDVAVVAKRFVAGTTSALERLGIAQVRLVARGEDETIVIPIGAPENERRNRLRKYVKAGLAIVVLAITSWIAITGWQADAIEEEIAGLNRQISTRKAALNAAKRAGQESDAAAKLHALRAAQAPTVEVIDLLSVTLPDHAYLTMLEIEKSRLRISGISNRSSELVPALEGSRRFTDVRFSAATTRVESGSADRFHLEMQVGAPPPESTP